MLILDDVGYVQQSPEEAEILTFLAERFRGRDAEETFAYMIMLSANQLLG